VPPTAYRCSPSGLITVARTPSSPRPSAQPSEPSRFTHPLVPLSCVSAPVVGLREKTEIASPVSFDGSLPLFTCGEVT
jgi:hypothetical protein